MKSLEEIKAGFASAESNQSNQSNNDSYPFWNINDGDQAVVRFLPDSNNENPLGFLQEKLMHTLYVAGQRKSVPCLKMYGDECPICKLSAEYYNADDKINGKRYYRNKQHLARVVIVKDPIETDGHEIQEGLIKTVPLGWQIYEKIKNAFESGELDAIPYDYEDGYNFNIKKKVVKSERGEFANYTNSDFARRSTPVTKHIAEENIQLVDLSTLLPPKPDLTQVEEWLEADLSGEAPVTNSAPSVKPGDLSAKLEALKSENTKPNTSDTPTSNTKVETNSTDDLDAEADAILADIMANR